MERLPLAKGNVPDFNESPQYKISLNTTKVSGVSFPTGYLMTL
jgi:hypothetical protein